jgi:hypothetical protein
MPYAPSGSNRNKPTNQPTNQPTLQNERETISIKVCYVCLTVGLQDSFIGPELSFLFSSAIILSSKYLKV